jgi:tetratricopeptide (TPR) repeat protein
MAIALPALAAVALFLALPRWVGGSGAEAPGGEAQSVAEAALTAPPPPAGRDEPGAPQSEPSRRAATRMRAEEAAQEARERLEALGARKAGEWAADAFDAAAERMDEGAERLRAGAWAEADSAFGQAVTLLESIDDRAPELLQEALGEGQRALAAGDAAAAAAAFSLAARIAPGDRMAETGLRRAAVLDELLRLLDSGRRHESDGNLARAEQDYLEAVRLDPLSPEAREALARIGARITDDEFVRVMSDGLAALEAGDYASARAAFRRADAIRPGARDVAEALTQVEEAEKLETLAERRRRAIELEREERWTEAIEQYAAALELDPSVAFAQNGRDRCRARATLAARIDYHLAHPDRLSADAVLQEATNLLTEAEEIEAAGPRHRDQLARLGQLIATASKPVLVVLESDNETEVTVYKVGRLGTFTRRSLELRPGRYTVVGSRPGYRDVRRQLVVIAGQDPEPLVVRCEEEI